VGRSRGGFVASRANRQWTLQTCLGPSFPALNSTAPRGFRLVQALTRSRSRPIQVSGKRIAIENPMDACVPAWSPGTSTGT
jgi:hypothetical protein